MRTQLKELIGKHAIIRAAESDRAIINSNGSKGSWLVDLRNVLMNPDGLELAADLFWDHFHDRLPFQVGGLVTASVPLVTAIILKGKQRGTPINGFFIRKERKEIGLMKMIEGQLTKEPIVIIDDLINGGSSIEKACAALQNEDRVVRELFTLLDYQNPHGHAVLRQRNIRLTALFTLKEFDLHLSKKSVHQPTAAFEYVWRFRSPEPSYHYIVPKSTPAVDNERVYFGSDRGTLWALDQKTGAIAWKYETDGGPQGKGIFSSPAVHRGRVYFGGYDGNVYCLDAKTGQRVWRYTQADWVGSSPALAPEIHTLFIGLEHGLPGQRGSLVALDLRSGKKKWEFNVREYLHGTPAYYRERQLVAVGTNDAELLLLDARTGQLMWRYAAGGEIKYAPTFDKKRNTIICGSHDGGIHIVDLDTGKLVWHIQTGNVIYSTPLIVGDYAYATSTDKHIYLLDLINRQIIQKTYLSGKIFSSPRKIGSHIYVGTTGGVMHELHPTTLKRTQAIQLPDRITNAITYGKKYGLFYALTYANELFALRRKRLLRSRSK